MSAHAWGRRGHSIVCQTAAALVASHSPNGAFLKQHSFDLGYYCNVPDLIWKKPATYSIEAPQHFMDLEVFDRAFKAAASQVADPFALTRLEFEKKYPEVPLTAGRSYWRIRELMDSLHETSETLKIPDSVDAKSGARFGSQEKWLVTAGAIGHYVGDLSQPLHVTEDFDGQKENQKGIHAFFENQLVDELSNTDHPGSLEADVGALAQKNWKSLSEKAAKLTVLEVIEGLAKESNDARAELLKIDKRVGRKEVKKSARAFEPMIKDRLAAGAVALAVLWGREMNWPYVGDKFYNFSGAPDYVAPPSGAVLKVKPAEAPTGPTPKL
jgi:hypothetical protein